LSPEQHPNFFPPTHAQETRNASEPELVSIIDLKRLQDSPGKKGVDPLTSSATFQPPGGCSFVSFAPSGLHLLTASKKGDVHYVVHPVLDQSRHQQAQLCTHKARRREQLEVSSQVP